MSNYGRKKRSSANRKKNAKRGTPPTLHAFSVQENGENSFWNRIGGAWEHEDGNGLTVHLNGVVPLDGVITLRVPKEMDEDNDQ